MNIPAFFKDRKWRQGLQSGGGLALTAAIALFANALSQKLFVRWDWTADHRYSLSPASKRLVKSLPDPVLLRLYLSPGLPQPYESQGRYVRDLLREYSLAGGDKVRVQIVNPEESDARKTEAQSAGVVPARFTQVASDQFQVREGFIGLALFYQDKQDAIPFVKDTDSLEYDVSSRIKRMSASRKPKIGFVTSHGETPPDGLGGEGGALFAGFELSSVDLSTAATGRPDVLFVVGPESPWKPEDVAALDRLIADGVPAVIAMNRKVLNLGSFRGAAQTTNLEPLLQHYGVTIVPEFVLDMQCQRISLQSQQGGFAISNIINYPAMPLSNRLDRAHPLTKSLDVLGFPFCHPLSFSTATPSALSFRALAESSPKSWYVSGLDMLNPYSISSPTPSDPRGPFPLAALVEGSTTSFSDPARAAKVKLVVIGTSRFADPQMPNPQANATFLLNLAEWLSQDQNMLSIPSRGSPYRPLRQLTEGAHLAVKWLGFFFPPALVLLAALLHWRNRSAKRASVRRAYAPQGV